MIRNESLRPAPDPQRQNADTLDTRTTPAGRVGTTADIGNAVIYLSSEAGSFINGIELVVDGGMTQIYQGKNGAE